MTKPARLLVIAGSDSSGGAGIQADIKTATALGAYAMTAITAVTVQNTQGVHAVHPIPVNIVRAQIVSALEDIGADAIKIGMLGSSEVIRAVAQTLSTYASDIPLVVDPVMEAKGGASLLEDDAPNTLMTSLFPLAVLITPNTPEASRLTGLPIESVADCLQAGQSLLATGAQAVLVKGGHLEGETVTDVLVSKSGSQRLTAPRLNTTSTHGTGCTLATAIAVGLAQDMPLIEAIRRARSYVQDAIRTAPGFGHGHGPLNHMHLLNRPSAEPAAAPAPNASMRWGRPRT
ncbi:MAG TPA: bifunctional hydroxymethylpyrimidine kinase/phosphomethylpyrimidine kinase [Rhizomicrobium sp.]|nr:bifunctional hydroxymethylpyrimidine kinase/phosphomethylpyrimidine kinase [Rhizomicrobium sp.]